MNQDGVILLHGIFRTARSMRPLARFLESQGYRVLNLDYASTRQTLEEIVETIHPAIASFAAPMTGRVHMVGYSMGGLIIRAYLARHRPKNLGRVVMLGTPNHGSEVADFLQDWWLYKKLYGPAGQQLITTFNTPIFGSVTYELGILAGNRNWDPVCNRLIGRENDGKVAVESTKLEGMKDHRVIRATHLFFPNNRTAWMEIAQFLKSGRFT